MSKEEEIEFDGLIGSLAPSAKVCHRPAPPRTWDPRAWLTYLGANQGSLWRQSWYLWRVVDGQGRPRLVLFQGTRLVCIPGNSFAHIFVFDVEGRLLSECDFSTGWRISIEDAHWLEDAGHGFPCVLVYSAPSINGADITSQYYAILDDAFALVRLEDGAGEFVRVNYHNPNHTIGPPVPERTAEQWEAAVRSSDRAEVLRTLVWLGGSHSDPPLRLEGCSVERFEEASRALEARARPGVRSAVEALTRSEDLWVREAARHAWEVIQERDNR